MNIKELADQAGLKRHQEQAPGIDGAVGSWDDLAKFAELVAAHEREAIADEYWSSLLSDMEHGVKCLNIQAAKDFNRTMPELSKFGKWLNDRSIANER
jgi:hypothetical protein